MIEFLESLIVFIKAYRGAKKSGSHYVAATSHGVPQIACFFALRRDAWRVSQRAVQEFELRRER